MHAFWLGALSGARSMTPVATVSEAARAGLLPARGVAGRLLSHPLVSHGLKLVALGEVLGDKMKSAPDRIVPAGMAARVLTAAVMGAAVAPRGARGGAAILSVAGAVGAAYLSFHARMWALRRYGQTRTGLIEDAIVLVASRALVQGAAEARR